MSTEEIEQLTVEQLAEEMMRCKLAAWEQIKNGESRMDDIEEALLHIQTDLKRSELQRTSYNEELKSDILELKDWFHKHGLDEMSKYDEIISAVKELRVDMVDNTNFIDKLKKYWFGLTVGFTTLTIVGGGIWWLVVEMEARGLIILFPK